MRKYRKWIILMISALIIGFISYYIYSVFKFGNGIYEDYNYNAPPDHNEDTKDTIKPPKWESKERVNILLLGVDSRGIGETESVRSDAIMVASIDPVSKQANLFSILRDTYVHIPDHGMERINAAFAYGNASLAMETVSEFLNLPIHYYVNMDFDGFIELVDAIGGVDFTVEKNMKYSDPSDDPEYDIDLKEGYQHLDGHKALQYVRFRHDSLSDFSRTGRQRNLLQVIANDFLSFSSLIKLPNTLKKVEPYLRTNMTFKEMWALGSLGTRIEGGLISDQLPPNTLLKEEIINRSAVITVDEKELQDYVQGRLFDNSHINKN